MNLLYLDIYFFNWCFLNVCIEFKTQKVKEDTKWKVFLPCLPMTCLSDQHPMLSFQKRFSTEGITPIFYSLSHFVPKCLHRISPALHQVLPI